MRKAFICLSIICTSLMGLLPNPMNASSEVLETLNNNELPNLKGGPEATERKNPVNHLILQEKYPETVVLRGPSNKNQVALTFDDGPDPRFTGKVLDVLKKYNVKATFFVMGSRARAYPDLVKRMIEEGHIVGNHTYWHPNLVQQRKATLRREINQTEDVLENIIGYRTKLFRPPYGFLNEELVEEIAKMDYTIVNWSVDTLDWKEFPPDDIAMNALSNVHPGAIILMHDGGEWDADRTNTIESLHRIIPTLKEQGMEFVTVPDLLSIPYKK